MKKAKNTTTTSTPKHTGAPMPLLTPVQFTQEMATALQRSALKVQTEIVQDLALRFTMADQRKGTLHLRNAYQKYLCNPGAKDAIVAIYICSFEDHPSLTPNAPIDSSRIVPILQRNSSRDDYMQGGKPTDNCWKRYTEDLIVEYAMDLPKAILFLTNAHLADLKMSVEELHKTAVENLKKLFPAPDMQEANGVYRVTCGGNYDVSLILVDEIWDADAFEVRGEIVVAVPARDCLLVTDSGDPERIRKLSELAGEVQAVAPYSVSSRLLVRRGGKFVPYPVTPSKS